MLPDLRTYPCDDVVSRVERALTTRFDASTETRKRRSLGFRTTRVAVSQTGVTKTICQVFSDVDTTVEEWTAAHADLAWANLTAPNCYSLDWEDWGTAPRGWDAASLWSESLAVPALADRVHQERRADLDSRAGKLARLYRCAQIIDALTRYAGPLLEPALAAAAKLLTDLRT